MSNGVSSAEVELRKLSVKGFQRERKDMDDEEDVEIPRTLSGLRKVTFFVLLRTFQSMLITGDGCWPGASHGQEGGERSQGDVVER